MEITSHVSDTWPGRCYQCGSTAVASRSELTSIKSGNGALYAYETCPVCQRGGPGVYGGMEFSPPIVLPPPSPLCYTVTKSRDGSLNYIYHEKRY